MSSESISSIHTDLSTKKQPELPKDVSAGGQHSLTDSIASVTLRESKSKEKDAQETHDEVETYSSAWTSETESEHIEPGAFKSSENNNSSIQSPSGESQPRESQEESGVSEHSHSLTEYSESSSFSDRSSKKSDYDKLSKASISDEESGTYSYESTGDSTEFESSERTSSGSYNSTETSRESDFTSDDPYSDSFEDVSPSESEDEDTKVQKTFMKNCIKKIRSPQPKTTLEPKKTATKLHYNDTELAAAETYCARMRERLKLSSQFREIQSQSSLGSVHRAKWKQSCGRPASECGVSPDVINKFKLDNCLMRLYKESDPAVTEKHRKRAERVEQQDFLKKKVNLVQNKVIEEKLSNVNLLPDTIMLLGELARDLPKLSDDPKEIMDKLLMPLRNRTDQSNT